MALVFGMATPGTIVAFTPGARGGAVGPAAAFALFEWARLPVMSWRASRRSGLRLRASGAVLLPFLLAGSALCFGNGQAAAWARSAGLRGDRDPRPGRHGPAGGRRGRGAAGARPRAAASRRSRPAAGGTDGRDASKSRAGAHLLRSAMRRRPIPADGMKAGLRLLGIDAWDVAVLDRLDEPLGAGRIETLLIECNAPALALAGAIPADLPSRPIGRHGYGPAHRRHRYASRSPQPDPPASARTARRAHGAPTLPRPDHNRRRRIGDDI